MHNICYAAKFIVPYLSVEPFGEISAVYGGLKIINKISRELQKPWDYAYACFDTKVSYRRNLYPSYKSNRTSTPEKEAEKYQIDTQMAYMYKVMSSLGFTVLRQDGFEADDFAALICNTHPEANKYIVSNDQDLLQLLSPNTFIYKKSGKVAELVTLESFQNKYGIPPSEWNRVKAMAGCTTDTIKGIDTIGEKRAIDYIKNTVAKKYKDKIEESQDIIDLNLKLVTLPFTHEVELPYIPVKDFNFNFENLKRVIEMFKFNFSLASWGESWITRH